MSYFDLTRCLLDENFDQSETQLHLKDDFRIITEYQDLQMHKNWMTFISNYAPVIFSRAYGSRITVHRTSSTPHRQNYAGDLIPSPFLVDPVCPSCCDLGLPRKPIPQVPQMVLSACHHEKIVRLTLAFSLNVGRLLFRHAASGDVCAHRSNI